MAVKNLKVLKNEEKRVCEITETSEFVWLISTIFCQNRANTLFCLFDSLRPINNLSVMEGWVFLG